MGIGQGRTFKQVLESGELNDFLNEKEFIIAGRNSIAMNNVNIISAMSMVCGIVESLLDELPDSTAVSACIYALKGTLDEVEKRRLKQLEEDITEEELKKALKELLEKLASNPVGEV